MAQGQIVAEGPPDSVMSDQRVIDAYLGAHHDAELTFEQEEKILAEAEAELAELAGEPVDLGSDATPEPAAQEPTAQEGERDE
jgi:branched-chain amino acid transport system ATP-binding protein